MGDIVAWFVINGQKFKICAKDLKTRATILNPHPIKFPCYIVNINQKIFPLKQPILEITQLQEKLCSTLDAYQVLHNLGFKIEFRRR